MILLVRNTITFIEETMPEHTPAPTPSRAVYGFVMYLGFKFFFIVFLIWAYVPHSWFEAIGITYLPNRYWALAIPVFLLTTLTIFTFFIYPSLGLCMTPNWDELRTIQDLKSKRNVFHDSDRNKKYKTDQCSCKNEKFCRRDEFLQIKDTFPEKRIPPLQDLKITDVSELLYLNKKSS